MNKKLCQIPLLVALALLLCACGGQQSRATVIVSPNSQRAYAKQAELATPTPTPAPTAAPSISEQLLSGMTLEQKIAQLFIVQPAALVPGMVTKAADGQLMQEAFERYPVGGVILFANNIADPVQLTDFTTSMQSYSDIPLFVSVDEEGGSVSRVANSPGFDLPRFGSMQSIGAGGDPQAAHEVGASIGSYLKSYGFNLDFAPVADVNAGPQGGAIGKRAFGSDPLLVADMAAAEIAGLKGAGIISCVKHFPGHGGTAGDTHDGYVSIEKTWYELEECDLIPFAQTLPDADMVMVAHIAAPNITTDGLPASLSRQMIQERLRDEMGYDGVVATDSLAMGAITRNYSSAESAVLALQAGADILLLPSDLAEAYAGVYEAVQMGLISEARVDESVLRILALKERYGLL